MWRMPEELLHMSLVSSYCVLLILPVRFLLSGCGRKYACGLWFAVFVNLVIPFHIQGSFSLIPGQMEYLYSAGQAAGISGVSEGRENVFLDTGETKDILLPDRAEAFSSEPRQADQSPLTEPGPSGQPVRTGESRKADLTALWQRLLDILQIIWLPGLLLILLYNLLYVMKMRKKLSRDQWKSWDEKERIAELDGLPGPFLWGICHPVIFLPAGLEESERICIVAHERCHRRRKDSVKKLAFFLAVSIHWFNPLVWLAWALFCRDMEICCDEEVFAISGGVSRRQYAQSLLKYAAAQNGYQVSSLTFGEPSARMRIRHILSFRKKHMLLQGTAGLAMAAMVLGLVIRPVAAKTVAMPEYVVNTEEADMPEMEALPLENAGFSSGTEAAVFSEAPESEILEPVWNPEHRMGYQRVELTHVIREDFTWFTPDLRPEGELEMLARTALQELYDLTGYQVENCVYECNDMGTFFFARTPEDLEHSRIFYARSFGEEEGYDELVIPSMDYVNARRVWFSDVQQLDIPENAETMSDGELAVWFLERSAVYRGEKVDHTESVPEPWSQRVYTTEGTYYEMTLEGSFIGVSSIYGPYPEEFSH